VDTIHKGSFLLFASVGFPAWWHAIARSLWLGSIEAREGLTKANPGCQWSYATGQRKNEVASLRWDMLDGDTLRIPGNVCKNRQARNLPLSAELMQIIERRKRVARVKVNGTVRMVEFIFHRDGSPIREFRKSWRTACLAAGVTALYHDFRRSCARNLIQAGVSPQVSRLVTGHLSDSIFSRYAICTDADVLAAMQKTEVYRATARAAAQKVVSIGRG
jgi:integrase